MVKPKAFREEDAWFEACTQFKRYPIDDLYTREQYKELSKMLLNIRGHYKYMSIRIDVTPPDYDSVVGAFDVTLSDTERSVTGGGVNLMDAFHMAEHKLAEEAKVNKIESVEMTPNIKIENAPKVEISAATLRVP